MAISGKYDFQGIKRVGAATLRVALASSPYSAWILKGGAATDFFLEFISNWLANHGLILLNLGYDYSMGHIDMREFNNAMSNAIREIEILGGRDKLTPKQKKDIDDEVIKAARKFIIIGRP